MGYDTFDRLCKAKGVSAYRVAKDTGVNTATLSSWKTGKYVPKDDKLQVLANYFGVTATYLRTGDDTERNERYEKAAATVREDLQHRSALGITNEEWELIEAFRYLNQLGQEKSMQYVVDLTAIDRYRNEENDSEYIRF